MARRGGGVLTALALALSLAVVALGGALLWLVATGGGPGSERDTVDSAGDAPRGELAAASFGEYSWDELARIASEIAAAPSDEEGRTLASEYGIEVGDTRALALDDGTQATLTVVGIRADERADGSGPAGLTLMTSPLAVRPMNDEPTCEDGWEGSALRAWLADEGMDLLPDELAERVVPASKPANAVGVTSDPASVQATADSLWLFSASEVCGHLSWFQDEYGTEPNPYTGYVDFAPYDELLNAEGEQYEYFRAAGVSGSSDPSGILELSFGGSPVAWWYRTPYPYSFTGEDASYFYQVISSGYPSTTGLASESAGVVAGMCL